MSQRRRSPCAGVAALPRRLASDPRAQQFLRYACVGAAVNVAAYLLYLLLVRAGLDPLAASATVFVVATIIGFLSHRSVTFRSAEGVGAFLRYIVAYSACLVLNLVAMYVLVDLMRRPHQFVQAGIIVVNALVLFLLQRYWIFRASATADAAVVIAGRNGYGGH